MKTRPVLPFLLLALLVPGVASAQNAITGESLQLHATFQNAGIMVLVSGDENADATANLEVDDGGGFRPAHRLTRSAPDRFVGSAFFLADGTDFQVRVTLADPDGVTTGELTGAATTRSLVVPTSSGATYHVSAAGSDTGDGTEASPFASVGRGLDAAMPGDTVMVHAGRYHEEIHLPRGGTAQAPITLRGAGDGPAILDGSEPALRDPTAWTDDGGHVYSASSSETRYVAVDGVRLWRYESLSDLQSLSEGTDGGFYFDGSLVHVRLAGDAAPAGHEIQVSTFGRALWLEGTPYVVVRDLTLRCYGAETYSQGVMVRDGSHGVWIVDNHFENEMPGIWVKNEVSDLMVMGNEFSDRGLAEFDWHAVKAQGGMESGAIGLDNQYDGQGIVFYRNLVHDSFDGMGVCGDAAMEQPNNVDVIENRVYHLGDDGIETDGLCSNVRIINNRFEDTLVGVSVAPAVGGPTYVIRNLMVDLKNVAPGSDWMTRAMKFNVGDSRPSGEIFAYHNTAVTYEPDQAAFGVTDSLWTAVHLRNNIWVGTDHALYYTNAGENPFFEDYDLLYSTGSRLVNYQGTHYNTIPEYFSAEAQCEHCLAEAPSFVDGPGGDYALLEESAAIDQGEIIAGVNDGFAGNGPDLGAIEFGNEGPSLPDAGTGGSGGTGGTGSGGTGGTAGTGSGATGGSAGSSAGSNATSSDDGGCGCRTASKAPTSPTDGSSRFLWLGAAACFLALRRRGG